MESAEWTVLDASGDQRFKVKLPRAFKVQTGTLEWVWGTTLDDLDVPYIVRYDIR
jgi:hypothetical protein